MAQQIMRTLPFLSGKDESRDRSARILQQVTMSSRGMEIVRATWLEQQDGLSLPRPTSDKVLDDAAVIRISSLRAHHAKHGAHSIPLIDFTEFETGFWTSEMNSRSGHVGLIIEALDGLLSAFSVHGVHNVGLIVRWSLIEASEAQLAPQLKALRVWLGSGPPREQCGASPNVGMESSVGEAYVPRDRRRRDAQFEARRAALAEHAEREAEYSSQLVDRQRHAAREAARQEAARTAQLSLDDAAAPPLSLDDAAAPPLSLDDAAAPPLSLDDAAASPLSLDDAAARPPLSLDDAAASPDSTAMDATSPAPPVPSDARVVEVKVAKAKVATDARVVEVNMRVARAAEAKVAEVKAAEAKVAEAKVVEARPMEVVEARIVEVKVAKAKAATDARVAEVKIRVARAKVAEEKSAGAKSAEAKAAEEQSAEASLSPRVTSSPEGDRASTACHGGAPILNPSTSPVGLECYTQRWHATPLEITIHRSEQEASFGLVVNLDEHVGSYIAAITPGTPAARCDLLRLGDVVVGINYQPLTAGEEGLASVPPTARTLVVHVVRVMMRMVPFVDVSKPLIATSAVSSSLDDAAAPPLSLDRAPLSIDGADSSGPLAGVADVEVVEAMRAANEAKVAAEAKVAEAARVAEEAHEAVRVAAEVRAAAKARAACAACAARGVAEAKTQVVRFAETRTGPGAEVIPKEGVMAEEREETEKELDDARDEACAAEDLTVETTTTEQESGEGLPFAARPLPMPSTRQPPLAPLPSTPQPPLLPMQPPLAPLPLTPQPSLPPMPSTRQPPPLRPIVTMTTASMTLSILKDIDVQLEVRFKDFKFKLTGPKEKIEMLREAAEANEPHCMDSFDWSSDISPRWPLTLPDEVKVRVGIPEEACSFCFAYPMGELEQGLEIFNLSSSPWAFFFLCGGFLYFDEKRDLISVNAVSLTPSPLKLELFGPFECDSGFIAALTVLKRFDEVTIDALRDVGFLELAFVGPAEQLRNPDGRMLNLGLALYGHGVSCAGTQTSAAVGGRVETPTRPRPHTPDAATLASLRPSCSAPRIANPNLNPNPNPKA